ncbi:MAG: hypothetical protein R3B40_21195 [Polyangiales bacterium]
MRSRPDLSVYLSPQRPTPGERLHARVVLTSRSETPYDLIEVTLVGRESRYEHTSGSGDDRTSHYHRREVMRLRARFDAGVLAPGTSERMVTFDIPRDAPPAYKSRLASISYTLGVRVHIPWWPDRQAAYTVPVETPPEGPGRPRPQLFTTLRGEQRDDTPVLELSLEGDRLAIGGQLAGAVAITGLGNKRVRRVELACVTVETPLVKSSTGTTDVDHRTWVLHKGTPADGASIPFRLAIPKDLAPTFRSPYIRVTHAIEARAVVALGSDIVLRVPAVALRSKGTKEASVVPLLGSARHATVWQAALREVQKLRLSGLRDLRYDAEHGVGSFACHEVSVVLAEEEGAARKRRTQRSSLVSADDTGPCVTAELSWPALGLDLRVAERRWTDFGKPHAALDRSLHRRFTVRAREPEQAASLLTPALRDALFAFDEAGLDDERVVVLRRGGVYREASLVRFVREVHRLASVVAPLLAGIAPPSAFAADADAWRALSRAHGARLRPGDFALVDWSMRGVPLVLTHRWEDGTPVSSELSTTLPEGVDTDAWRDALGKAVRGTGFVHRGRVGATLPSLARPDTLLGTAEAFATCVTRLSGADMAPYR